MKVGLDRLTLFRWLTAMWVWPVAALVVGACVVWPRIPLGVGSLSGNAAAADLAMAAIVAAVFVLVPAAASARSLALSQFSWKAAGVLFDRSNVFGTVVVAIAGIGLPIVAAVNVTAAMTRLAFAGFSVGLLVIAESVARNARRANPAWLVGRTVDKAVKLVDRGSRSRPALTRYADPLTDLIGSTRLPVEQYREAAAAWALLQVARFHAGEDPQNIVQAVQALAANLRREPDAAHDDAIAALAAVGRVLSHDAVVSIAVIGAIGDLARQARSQGQAASGTAALDALVVVVGGRLEALLTVNVLPDMQSATPRRYYPHLGGRPREPMAVVPPPRKIPRAEVVSRPGDAVEWKMAAEISAPPPAGATAVLLPTRAAIAAAARAPLDVFELIDLVRTIRPSGMNNRATADEEDRESRRHSYDAYDLLQDEVNRLQSLFAAPTPAATGWPGGWQGSRAFDADVRRLGSLADELYATGRLPGSDAVEEQLEQIGLQLNDEVRPARALPPDRTGWRTSHMPTPDGPAVVIAEALRILAVNAFVAGFDHRALLTGRRLLTLATMAAHADDEAAVTTYAEGISRFAREIDRTGVPTDARRHRVALIIAGLIAELDPLIAAAANRYTAVDDLVEYLPYRADKHELPLVVRTWQARLSAAGWPTDFPTRTVGLEAPHELERLPAVLLSHAREELSRELRRQPILPAALLLVLWADAMVAAREGHREVPLKLSEFLTQLLREYDDDAQAEAAYWASEPEQPDNADEAAPDPDFPRDEAPSFRAIDPQVRQLIEAAITWTRKPTSPKQPTIPVPPSGLARGLHVEIRDLLAKSALADCTYHGVIQDEAPLVIVEHADGSRRLLRDEEATARGLFAWGYGGTGPHTLAEALAINLLAELRQCPDCFGAIVVAAGLIRCRTCHNTGYRLGEQYISHALVTRVIAHMPNDSPWTRSRRALLAEACQPGSERSTANRLDSNLSTQPRDSNAGPRTRLPA